MCFMLNSTSGELAHALRFLASVVSQSFLAFGDILELNRKFVELSGGINRIFELEELLDAAQHGPYLEFFCFFSMDGLGIIFCDMDIGFIYFGVSMEVFPSRLCFNYNIVEEDVGFQELACVK